jgi:hypothetical protein
MLPSGLGSFSWWTVRNQSVSGMLLVVSSLNHEIVKYYIARSNFYGR